MADYPVWLPPPPSGEQVIPNSTWIRLLAAEFEVFHNFGTNVLISWTVEPSGELVRVELTAGFDARPVVEWAGPADGPPGEVLATVGRPGISPQAVLVLRRRWT